MYTYICVSLVAQIVKNLPAMWETQIQSLGWEVPLEKGVATHSSNLAWRIPWTEATVHGVAKSQTRLTNTGIHTHLHVEVQAHRYICLPVTQNCLGPGEGEYLDDSGTTSQVKCVMR